MDMNSCDSCKREDVKCIKVFDEVSFTSNLPINHRQLCYSCFKMAAQKYLAETRARKNN
jgi:hypothetical protein